MRQKYKIKTSQNMEQTINVKDFKFPKGVKITINGQEVKDTYTFDKLGKQK